MVSQRSIYKSAAGEATILGLYDQFQRALGVEFEERTVETRHGRTHVLVTGPADGPPVVTTHGGNSINPQSLGGLLPLLRLYHYRVYAPDTVGHPGKSAQTRLSPADASYGEWLHDVLDALYLPSAAFVGGSFGAGIILRLAAFAPERISRAALFVPSGIAKVPWSSMVFKIGLPYLLYSLLPSEARLKGAVRWMGDGLDEGTLELVEAVLKHVRVEAEMPRPAAREELARFRAPTLVIAGEKDAMFPGEAVVRRAKEIIPNLVAAECLTGATHLCSPADMEHINRRIREFLASGPAWAV
jgi:pimeloyl-ACP methyl ester carboxylesterase